MITDHKSVSSGRGEEEAGEEEGGEVMVDIKTLPREERELTHTHTRTPVVSPELLVAMDTRHLEL